MHVVHEQADPREQVLLFARNCAQHLQPLATRIFGDFPKTLLVNGHEMQVISEFAVTAATRPFEVHAIIGELMERQHRPRTWIGHRVML